MNQKRSPFHFLSIIPLSVFADWELFLPTALIPIIGILVYCWFLEHTGRFYHIKSLGDAVCFIGYAALWFISCSVTRLGNPKAELLLRVIPLEPWKRTLLIIIEHILMVFLWLCIPVGIIAYYVQPESFSWMWFFVVPAFGMIFFSLRQRSGH